MVLAKIFDGNKFGVSNLYLVACLCQILNMLSFMEMDIDKLICIYTHIELSYEILEWINNSLEHISPRGGDGLECYRISYDISF